MPRFRQCRIGQVFVLCVALVETAFSAVLGPIDANDNHTPAGVLRNGVLSIQLEIAKGEWHPEAENGIALSVYAFGEAGHPLQNPGPLIRVPLGTEIDASVHNTLPVAVEVHGFGNTDDSAVHLEPAEVAHAKFKPITPGLFLYWGASENEGLTLRHGLDAELTGAIVVDPPDAKVNDEIFVMEMISEIPGAGARQTLATINGKSWPHTQRFRYAIGEPVHWRWANATNEPHALHLHGFYYRVEAFNRGGHVQIYEGESRPNVVTQRIAQGETFDMSWAPDRPGQWLFHCHMIQHMNPPSFPHLPGLDMTTANGGDHASHETSGMGQMVLGITVPGIAEELGVWHPSRKLQLEISERSGPPRYALRLKEEKEDHFRDPGLIGPAIVLTRGEPVEIEVLNRLNTPTAIHWHGIELQSYYDGVPGWSGNDKQVTPAIAPGTSFVARMTPPRAGTFIYHTHWHDDMQLTNGVYGPLIVMPPEEKYDPASDLPFVFSIGDFGELKQVALINGTPDGKPIPLLAGKKYRFRLINISTNNQAMKIMLRGPEGLSDWTIVAKDGANLPISAVRSSKAELTITVGETYDVEFTSGKPQDLLLDLVRPALKMHTIRTLSFALPGKGKDGMN